MSLLMDESRNDVHPHDQGGVATTVTDKPVSYATLDAELEESPHGFFSYCIMWTLAFVAMLSTCLEIAFLAPFWTAVHGAKVLKKVVERWQSGSVTSAAIVHALSRTLSEVRRHAGGDMSMYLTYFWPERSLKKSVNLDEGRWWGCEAFTSWWFGIRNAVDVRNRLRVVANLLAQEYMQFAELHPGETLRLLIPASGRAQAPLEALAKVQSFLKEKRVHVELRLLDMNEPALSAAHELATRLGLKPDWVVVRTYIGTFEDLHQKVCDGGRWQPHGVELVGLLEYLSDGEAQGLFRAIYDLLAPGGFCITSQLKPNREAYVVRWLFAWRMIYRTTKQLLDIVACEGGFSYHHVRPYKVGWHTVLMARKPVFLLPYLEMAWIPPSRI